MKTVIFDLETQRLSYEVEGGWQNIEKFGLSVAVTWDRQHGFRSWFEEDANRLVNELAGFERVVGFNLLRFDYFVLVPYVPDVFSQLKGKTFDIHSFLYRLLGERVSLDELARATLRRGKFSTGEDVVRWWRDGEINKVIEHCKTDVMLTRDIYEYGLNNGFVYCDSGKVDLNLWRQKRLNGSLEPGWGEPSSC